MKIITAPNSLDSVECPAIFLAGSIEMGAARDWQDEVGQRLSTQPGTILNPRRRDWDSSWVQSIKNPQFVKQVEWELRAQTLANVILMHFEPETKSPISLLELGLFHKKMIVHCPEGFWRKGNVDIVCRWYDIQIVDTIKDLINAAITSASQGLVKAVRDDVGVKNHITIP